MDRSAEGGRLVSASEVWRSIFRATYSVAKPAPMRPPDIVAHYSRFFRGHHGPCRVRWSDATASWKFTCCPHVDEDDVCQAHQGFLLGLLDASLRRPVKRFECHRSPDAACTLAFAWDEP